MWSLRVFSTFLLVCSVCGVFCVALNLPEKTCSGETCPEDDNSDSMPVHEFLELTDHEHVARKKDESESANVDATDEAKDGIATDGTKDIILNKLLKNAVRQKPNKLKGPSLIARYVQGMRGALDSGNGNIKEENNNDDAKKESKRDVDMDKQINFMSDFLDMDPLSIKTNKINDTFQNSTNDDLEAEKDANDTELKNQDLILNLTEKQDNHLDFMTNFLDDDHMDVQTNANETENENVTEVHVNLETNVTDTSDTQLKNQDLVLNLTEKQDNHLDFMTNFLDDDHMDVQINANATEHENVTAAQKNIKTNVTDTSENDILGMDVNVTENLVNATVDTTTGIVGKQLDFLANLLHEDPLETVSASESIESEVDSSVIEEGKKEIEKSTGDVNQLDFVTNFLNSDPFDLMDNPVTTTDEVAETEAIDRSDAVEISAIQEENLDFLTDFLSEDPAAVEANHDDQLASENKIPQDILELYSEDEVIPDSDEVHIRKKPISSNVEWVKEEPKENDSTSFWNWFGF